ncbi:MAG: sigma-54 dependent transcriptional regulator [Myxococcota bacterium]
MTDARVARVLVADDEESIRFVLRQALESAGHNVDEVADGPSALEHLETNTYDLAFLDIRMPEPGGIELLEILRASAIQTAAVIITAHERMEYAVEAMKLGALDYLVKPFSISEATALAEKALRTRSLEQEVRKLRREVGTQPNTAEQRLVGRSAALLEVFKTVGKVADSNVAVLVTGESGTGKELVAKAIHRASSRSDAPFVAVNGAAIPRELLESELFGHERGAFTGAIAARPGRFREASGGTLFLDEIGDMPLALQAKLLRALQSGEITSVGGRSSEIVDVRVIAATHRDLDVELSEGRFREDLLYRLRVVPIHLPPLRERAKDIRILAQHFVLRYSEELCDLPVILADDAAGYLETYSWPGNVRELENAVKRALVMTAGGFLTPEDFSFLVDKQSYASTRVDLSSLVTAQVLEALHTPGASDVYHRILENVERPLLEATLAHTQGNQLRAAALLGINRNTLRKKIVELRIDVPGRGD